MINKLAKLGVVPVVALDDAADAVKLAEALMEGGLPVAEITFRTAAAKESIKLIAENCPEMLVGAGTVLSVEQVKDAVSAGAKFIVTPGFDPEVVDYCLANDIPVFPGCMTPSEITQAYKRGLEVVKFFPAEDAGGLKMIKALSGPFPNIKFMPTGGINAGNLKAYLENSKIAACGGTWMVKKDLISAKDFDKIRELTKEAKALVDEVRG
ncbi:MAG: bifunctional 4-hydroxy-2-oxoglutarate aldolase/2-dehydro-3-deoxy-phosphogluconate aldolase [Clostridia bacterium]|nr:bifunctional 4-hydroxy-2-oxoglutarate aldolase/2-dehydro-3-deoxy-phosphogluconate aldolase [Clostridia bacterium]